MKQISNKEYEKYQQYQTDKLHGRILTPDGLRLICASLNNDPEKIGIHMLEILSDEYATNCWNQELSEVSTKVSKACDRAKLLIDDKELTDYLCLLTQDYQDIYASISRYLYSGVPAQMIQVARNNLQNQYGNAVSNPSFLVSNVAIRNQYIQMCENEITKELQRRIDAYCEMLSDDKFDIKFKKHLVIDELSV